LWLLLLTELVDRQLVLNTASTFGEVLPFTEDNTVNKAVGGHSPSGFLLVYRTDATLAVEPE
jgi:hypothetical protein